MLSGADIPGFDHIEKKLAGLGGVREAKLLPGQYYVTRTDEVIQTLLGSCISVCIWDEVAGIGGMNHFLLPDSAKDDGSSPRYGIGAMDRLIQTLLDWGAKRERLSVKLTGGGEIGMEGGRVAKLNIAFAERFLAEYGLIPLAKDVGGPYPRKVRFHPLTGRLMVLKLDPVRTNLEQFTPRRRKRSTGPGE